MRAGSLPGAPRRTRASSRTCRRLLVVLVAASALGLAAAPVASAALPSTMAALGDAFSKGYAASGVPGSGDYPAGSWVTGTDATVNSHYSRLLALNPAISGNATNLAADGKKMAAVATQATSVPAGTEYVTIMAGTQDVCTNTVSQMTSVSSFKTSLTNALTTLTTNLPNAKILVASIPNWYALWQAYQSNPSALSAWSTYNNRCPDLLSSTATQTDRDTFRTRIINLNNAESQACAGFAACTYDGGAVYNLSFAVTDLSYDYFSPSLSGQALISAALWAAGPYAPPVNTAAPTVSGSAQEGQTLSATTGTWSGNPASYGYQWQRCNSSGAGCTSISGATVSSYQLVSDDVGHTLRVAVTATSANGSPATANSTVTEVVTGQAPSNTAAPTVSGTAQEGQTLSATTGTWTGSPTSFAYQWLRCDSAGANCAAISGATASSYQLGSGDVGSTIRVAVTATNGGGSASATSDQTVVVVGAAPANTSAPTISGQAKRGQTLTADAGAWTGNPTFAYEWQRCNQSGGSCAQIAGETGTTYVLTTADVDHTLRVAVTGTNGSGSVTATSAATAVVVAAVPDNTSVPTVSGNAQEGQTLTADAGTWTESPSSFAYQWRRCNGTGGSCANISGATDSSYVLADADIDSTVRVRVTATNGGGSANADSDPTAVVVALAPTNTALPAISGTAQEGQALSASAGTWTGHSPSYAYQWLLCDGNGGNCTEISGQTGTSYTLVSADVGGRVAVRVTATNSGGSTPATSSPSAVVKIAAPTNTAAPTVSGSAQEGQTLSADPGSWTHSPTFGYQWQRCNSSGAGCTSVTGATSQTYDLTSADIGFRMRVHVTGTNDGGSASADSTPTSVVVALPPSNTSLPVVSGTTVENQTLSTTSGGWSGNSPSYTYQWQRCSSSGSSCTAISGATSSSYQLKAADVGSTIRAAVTATNSGGSVTATSDATTVVTQAAPTNTALPAISGTAQEGSTLTATAGSWTGGPTFAYQWQRCNQSGGSCAPIDGETATSHVLTSADVDHTLRVAVTATNGGGSSTATSNQTASVLSGAPTNTSTPTISGIPEEGQTLTAAAGTWTRSPTYAYQWRRCDQSGGACANIAGATASTYALGANDVDTTIRVRVTATNAGGSATADSQATPVVVAVAPSNTAAPTISGQAQEGKTLSTTTGTWSGHNLAYEYQWKRCDTAGDNCTPISSATWLSYPLTAADVGRTLRVDVTATNSGGSATATSAPTAVVTEAPPVNTAVPVVSGTAQEGQTLSATSGTWTHSPTFAFQWQRCNSAGTTCTSIGGATNSTYALTDTDIGFKIRIHVTATNTGGSASADSTPTAAVIALPPVNTAVPVVSGTALEGQTLSTTTGGWTGNNPTYAYQWQRCDTAGAACTAIASATTSSYKLVLADVGHTIRAAATATNSGGAVTAASDPTAVVSQASPANTALPTIAGTVQEGQTLTGTNGTWTGNPTFAYRWLRCDTTGAGCAAINGQTASTYLVSSADAEHTLRFEVTGTNSGGSTTATSNATTVVKDPPANTDPPVVSGAAHEGQTLSTTAGTWTGNPTLAYRWRRCDTNGASCVSIAGATATSYVLTSGDVDHTIRVDVTGTNAGGSVTATSAPTAVVTAAAFAPSVSGFSPSSGIPGTKVTISGTRLYRASSVRFNGVAATITSNTASAVAVLVPSGATTGKVSVTTQDGSATSAGTFTVNPSPVPKISGFTPTSGVPGAKVTISGSGLLGATSVKFNGAPATIASNTATAIGAYVPAGATTGKISVTTPGGTVTSAGTFNVNPSPIPKITGLTPTSGVVGQTVTISGSGLLGATSVKFNGTDAKIVSVAASAVKAVVPLGATTGKLSVTTPGGTAVSGATFTVKASPVPKITGFTPTSGVPGTVVTISGSGFLGTTAVKFGGVAAEISAVAGTSIKALVPPGAPTATVTVTTPGGTAVSSAAFTVL